MSLHAKLSAVVTVYLGAISHETGHLWCTVKLASSLIVTLRPSEALVMSTSFCNLSNLTTEYGASLPVWHR